MKKKLLLIVFLLINFTICFAQKTSKIIVENSDFYDINQNEVPDALLLTGNVRVRHDGVVLTCNKAYYFQKENYIKAFGEVQMVQGDTLYLNSKYAEYNGNVKKAFASGNVLMTSPESTMTTDTINLDRNIQEAYFNSNATIINKKNTLKSKSGRYYIKEKKYQFLTSVEPDNQGNTTYTAYFKDPENAKWILIASFLRPQTSTWYTRAHSFLENFNDDLGYLNREVQYQNQWVVDDNGKWYSLHKAKFTGDDIARRQYRLDADGGIKGASFFLRNGGFFNSTTPLNSNFSLPPSNQKPDIDFTSLP